MRATSIARCIAKPHALEAARVVSGHGLALARHYNLGMSEPLGGEGGALRQQIADPFASGDLLDHVDHAQGIAPGESVSRQPALLGGLHVHRECAADLDRIPSEVVALIDHLGDGRDVVVVAVRAERPGGFVLDTFHTQALPRARFELDLLLASDCSVPDPQIESEDRSARPAHAIEGYPREAVEGFLTMPCFNPGFCCILLVHARGDLPLRSALSHPVEPLSRYRRGSLDFSTTLRS